MSTEPTDTTELERLRNQDYERAQKLGLPYCDWRCPVCFGEGEYQLRFGRELRTVKCQRCRGTGESR